MSVSGLFCIAFEKNFPLVSCLFKNAISFGTEIPAEPLPDFVGKIHTFDEGIGIDRLKMSLKIYMKY